MEKPHATSIRRQGPGRAPRSPPAPVLELCKLPPQPPTRVPALGRVPVPAARSRELEAEAPGEGPAPAEPRPLPSTTGGPGGRLSGQALGAASNSSEARRRSLAPDGGTISAAHNRGGPDSAERRLRRPEPTAAASARHLQKSGAHSQCAAPPLPPTQSARNWRPGLRQA